MAVMILIDPRAVKIILKEKMIIRNKNYGDEAMWMTEQVP